MRLRKTRHIARMEDTRMPIKMTGLPEGKWLERPRRI
jgi:hypothetical protein